MKFAYTALNKQGKKEVGVIAAPSSIVAGHLLKEQGLIPTELHEAAEQTFSKILQSLQAVKLAEKIVFIQDLSIMLKSGIPVARSLKIITKQTHNKRFAKILEDITQGIENGKTLHESLDKYPAVFSSIFVSMIKVGELSGNLDESLQYLTVQLEREAELKSRIRGAMIYPAVIVVAMVIIGIVMSIFVLPKLTAVFKDFNTELPFMTKIVIAISDFMAAHSIIAVAGLVIAVTAFLAFLRTPPGKRGFDNFMVRMPIVNPIVKKINLARFARVFSSLLKSGIPVVEGLQVAGESMPNVLYREAIINAGQNVKVGKSLTEELAKNEVLFPVIVVQMLEVGEETGSLETILAQLAGHYEGEVDATLKDFSSIIEPLLLLVIGSVVGVLAYALIIPIYSIGSNIQ